MFAGIRFALASLSYNFESSSHNMGNGGIAGALLYSSISVFSTHSNSLARLRKAIGGMNSILGSFLLSFESIVRGSKGSCLVKIVPMTHYVCLAHMKIRVLFKTGVCLYIFVLTKNSACVLV